MADVEVVNLFASAFAARHGDMLRIAKIARGYPLENFIKKLLPVGMIFTKCYFSTIFTYIIQWSRPASHCKIMAG